VHRLTEVRHSDDPIESALPEPTCPDDFRPAVPIFHQPWWLEAVAPGQWDAVTVERGGRTVARLPFVVRGPRRLRVLTQPALTPFLGPWVDRQQGAKYAKALGDEMELQAELAAALPPAGAFRQNFSPTVSGCLPFLWAGFRAGVRYTYRLEHLGSEQELWAGLSGNIRREIRKARRQVEVREGLGVDRFHAVWSKTFARQGLAAPDRHRLERIEAACAGRGARHMLFACDESDRVHAVAYLVWDRCTAYYLMGGGDPDLRTSGASSLLMWEAILRARSVTEVFDFEGSMLPPVERFFRAFGGRQTPYLQVSRAGLVAGAALAVRGNAQRLLAHRRR
jgi:Acetyltransferase (GNAT) domain